MPWKSPVDFDHAVRGAGIDRCVHLVKSAGHILMTTSAMWAAKGLIEETIWIGYMMDNDGKTLKKTLRIWYIQIIQCMDGSWWRWMDANRLQFKHQNMVSPNMALPRPSVTAIIPGQVQLCLENHVNFTCKLMLGINIKRNLRRMCTPFRWFDHIRSFWAVEL